MCHERQDLMLLYVSDLLDDAERADLRAHLATGCLTCSARLAEAQAVIEQIGLSLNPVAPPEQLRSELLSRAAAQTSNHAPEPRPAHNNIASNDQPGQRGGRSHRLAIWLTLVGGGAAAAVLIFSLGSYHFVSELQDARQTAQTLEDRVSEAETKIERSDTFIDLVRGLVASTALEIISFEGNDDFPDGSGRLLWDRDTNTCYVTVRSLAD